MSHSAELRAHRGRPERHPHRAPGQRSARSSYGTPMPSGIGVQDLRTYSPRITHDHNSGAQPHLGAVRLARAGRDQAGVVPRIHHPDPRRVEGQELRGRLARHHRPLPQAGTRMRGFLDRRPSGHPARERGEPVPGGPAVPSRQRRTAMRAEQAVSGRVDASQAEAVGQRAVRHRAQGPLRRVEILLPDAEPGRIGGKTWSCGDCSTSWPWPREAGLSRRRPHRGAAFWRGAEVTRRGWPSPHRGGRREAPGRRGRRRRGSSQRRRPAGGCAG
jgi:hypothetical protein